MWSEQTQASNLPTPFQEALSIHKNIHTLRLMAALLRTGEDDYEKLSPQMYGFLPQRSTHHFLMYLHANFYTSVVAFFDPKSAFNVANREIILDQLVEFGVQGNLLKWIRGYLSNRTSRILFQGTCSTSREFKLGTPQGGV
ncbi:uncharacterized protein LOC143034704 [Oratosquilla oratoria]|uniref:uncharacterized protein LOC143034704 n=1 Tax=Oratosquilla oratoria TaxID=337810 RepID=UPI003F768D80